MALSVTLTAVSSLTAFLTTPLALALLQSQDGEASGIAVPRGILAGQMALLLVLPVLVGMQIRRRWPNAPRRHGKILLGFGVAALVALLGIVISREIEEFASALANLLAAAILFTVMAFGAGWMIGWACAGEVANRFTVGMVFVVRNVGIATAIALTALGRVEFAVFATAYFLVQVPVLLAFALVFRRIRPGEGSHFTGAFRS